MQETKVVNLRSEAEGDVLLECRFLRYSKEDELLYCSLDKCECKRVLGEACERRQL